MTITQASLTSGSDLAGGTTAVTASISPTADRLVLLSIVAGFTPTTNAAVPTSVSGAGLTFALVNSEVDTTNGIIHALYRALSASPSSGAVTATFANTISWARWNVWEHGGVDTGGGNGSAAVVQSAKALDATVSVSTLTATLSAFGSATNGAAASHFWANFTGAPETATVDTGWTEIYDGGDTDTGPVSFAVQSQWRASSDTSAAVTWSGTGYLSSIAVEIKEAAGVFNGPFTSRQSSQKPRRHRRPQSRGMTMETDLREWW